MSSQHLKRTPTWIHQRLLAFFSADTMDISTVHQWVRKLRDSGRNLDLNDQLQSERPDTTTHDLNRQDVDDLLLDKQ